MQNNDDQIPFTGKKIDVTSISFFGRALDKIKSSWSKIQRPQKPKVNPLHGRIQELHESATNVLEELAAIQNAIKAHVSKDLLKTIDEVVHPIAKEIQRLQFSIDIAETPAKQAKAFQRYHDWVEKAKIWIDICSKAEDKKLLTEGVIKYLVVDFLAVIDRDLQVVEDYQEHIIEDLGLNNEEKQVLTLQLTTKLDPYLNGLKSLKIAPENLTLQSIPDWKQQIDKRRETYFDGALHVIDKIIKEHQ